MPLDRNLVIWRYQNLYRRAVRKYVPGGRTTFFEPEAFPFVAHAEAKYDLIREEVDGLLGDVDAIPTFQALDAQQEVLTTDEGWRTYPVMVFGEVLAEARMTCPETLSLLDEIPGVENAFFSIFAAGKVVPPHVGPSTSLLRFHLAVRVPEPADQCGIRVGRDIRHWIEGKSLVFDDTHEHEAWNRTDGFRVVLFVDFARPTRFPWSVATALGVHSQRWSTQAADVREKLDAIAS